MSSHRILIADRLLREWGARAPHYVDGDCIFPSDYDARIKEEVGTLGVLLQCKIILDLGNRAGDLFYNFVGDHGVGPGADIAPEAPTSELLRLMAVDAVHLTILDSIRKT